MDLIQLALPQLLKGLWVTLTLSMLAVAIGFNLGLGLSVMRLSDNRVVRGFAKGYSTLFRGTPLLVQIFILYYGLGEFAFIRNSPVVDILGRVALCGAGLGAEHRRLHLRDPARRVHVAAQGVGRGRTSLRHDPFHALLADRIPAGHPSGAAGLWQ